jgi:hypothetical protein
MNWGGGFKIKMTDGSIPRSDHAPALTSDSETVVYMAYVGKGGENLYLASCNASNGTFTSWQGNHQIKSIHGEVPQGHGTPALVLSANPYGPYSGGLATPYLVYADHRSGQLMETFNTSASSWTDPIEVSGFSGISKDAWTQPVMLCPMLTYYLLAVAENGAPWYCTRMFELEASGMTAGETPWTQAQPVQRSAAQVAEQANVKCWRLSEVSLGENTWIVLLGISETDIFFYNQIQLSNGKSVPVPDAWVYSGKLSFTAGHVNAWAATLAFGPAGSIETILALKGQSKLCYTALGFPTLSLAAITPITDGAQHFESKAPPGATTIGDSTTGVTLCIAYKGASNDDLYFAYSN